MTTKAAAPIGRGQTLGQPIAVVVGAAIPPLAFVRSRRGRDPSSVYVNKNLIGMYRGVGFPLACILAELLTDLAADALGIDTVEFKRRNYRPKASLPCVTPGGQRLETVCLRRRAISTRRARPTATPSPLESA
jgi:CO/xanthine dehydrogenase Mo-binding subunit